MLKQLNDFFHEASSGLLVNERILNLPPELIPSLHDSLLKDMEWAQQNAVKPFTKQEFQFKKLLIVSKCYQEKRYNEKAQKKMVEDCYYHFEDEIYAASSLLKFNIGNSTKVNPSAENKKSKSNLLHVEMENEPESADDITQGTTSSKPVRGDDFTQIILIDASTLPDIVGAIHHLYEQAKGGA